MRCARRITTTRVPAAERRTFPPRPDQASFSPAAGRAAPGLLHRRSPQSPLNCGAEQSRGAAHRTRPWQLPRSPAPRPPGRSPPPPPPPLTAPSRRRMRSAGATPTGRRRSRGRTAGKTSRRLPTASPARPAAPPRERRATPLGGGGGAATASGSGHGAGRTPRTKRLRCRGTSGAGDGTWE